MGVITRHLSRCRLLHHDAYRSRLAGSIFFMSAAQFANSDVHRKRCRIFFTQFIQISCVKYQPRIDG